MFEVMATHFHAATQMFASLIDKNKRVPFVETQRTISRSSDATSFAVDQNDLYHPYEGYILHTIPVDIKMPSAEDYLGSLAMYPKILHHGIKSKRK